MLTEFRTAAEMWNNRLMELLTIIFTDKKVIKELEMPGTEAYAEAEMDRIIETEKDYK